MENWKVESYIGLMASCPFQQHLGGNNNHDGILECAHDVAQLGARLLKWMNAMLVSRLSFEFSSPRVVPSLQSQS